MTNNSTEHGKIQIFKNVEATEIDFKNEIPDEEQSANCVLKTHESKKRKNYDLVPMLKFKKSIATLDRIDGCASWLKFVSNEKRDKHKLFQASFCGNRWCPECAWRKSRKDAMKLSIVMTAIEKEYKYEFIFLTLTTPNVSGDKLEDEIKHFNASFYKMMKRKKIRGWGDKGSEYSQYNGFVQGYMKRVEVTYNAKRDDYNPHLHVLIAVKKKYFKDPDQYMTRQDWLELWRECTGQSEITQVDVRKVKHEEKDNAVLEMAKYAVKDADYMINQEVFDNFYKALNGKRYISYAGILKDYAKRYDDGELDKYKQDDNERYVYMLIAKFDYASLKYEHKYREINAHEMAIIYPELVYEEFMKKNPSLKKKIIEDGVYNREGV